MEQLQADAAADDAEQQQDFDGRHRLDPCQPASPCASIAVVPNVGLAALPLVTVNAMTKQQHHHLDRISVDPQVMVGKPVVKGTRIPVERVLAQLAGSLDMDELFAAFPHLTVEDVQACLAYAHDTLVAERNRAVSNHPAHT